MPAQIDPEVRRVLQGYVDGQLSNAELEDWLTQVEYDDSLSDEGRDALGEIRLALIEVSEGSAEPGSVLDTVTAVLAAAEPQEPVIAFRSGATTVWEQRDAFFTATPSRPQRAGI